MAAWLPVLKAALPYIGNIVAAAVPVFTSRKELDASAELISRQIAELQAAVTGNAEAVKGLATQVERTITALDAGEADLAQRLAALQETLARCESTTSLVQAEGIRQEAVAMALQTRIDELEQQLASARRGVTAFIAVALLALIVAFIALLR
jgi:hypothetical protein